MQVTVLDAGDESPTTILRQLHLHRRIGVVKGAEDIRHPGFEKLRRRPDPEYPTGAAGEHAASRRQCLGFGQDSPAAHDELTPLGRQLEDPTDTIEESELELVLEITYLPRQRRLAHVQALAGPGHAAGVDDADEVAEVPELHGNRYLAGIDPRRSSHWTECGRRGYLSGQGANAAAVWEEDIMNRRTFLGSAVGPVLFGNDRIRMVSTAEGRTADPAPPEPLVWPIVTKPRPGVRSFAGHTDTVPDIAGWIGRPASLVIFTEGNHLMVLLGEDIVGEFPAWARAQPRYADQRLDNIVVVTLPQPVCLDMIRTGAVALGNLTLDVSRESGFYPDIFMGYPEPLRQLRRLGVVEPQARFFCKNRGVALLVRNGNPLGIQGLPDVVRAGARLALPDSGDVRAQCRAAADALLGKGAADALFAAEVPTFSGRLGIMHRDLPEMVARGYADVAFTWRHLVSYWVRIFPHHFALVPVPGAEPFFTRIAYGHVRNPLRPGAVKAFDEFFFGRAKEIYPRYDFARMNDEEYGAALALD